jgi:hypothetical protein
MPASHTFTPPGRTYPAELDRAECLRLLESVDIGRVIYTERAMPAAAPVRYILNGAEIFFRTDNMVMAEAAGKGAVFAIQVDQIDPQTHWGWHALGLGRACQVIQPGKLAELNARMPAPWSPKGAHYTLGIPLSRLTGHRRHADGGSF